MTTTAQQSQDASDTVQGGVTAAADEAGFVPERLQRLPKHFAGYVDDGRLAGVALVVSRGGTTALRWSYGFRDRERHVPMTIDTLFRIYSMTKPLASLALCSLYEEGRFQLEDPISRWLPGFAAPSVVVGGTVESQSTRPAEREITVRDLLTHTSGLTYGNSEGIVAGLYRQAGLANGTFAGDLAQFCDQVSKMPLVADPGTLWNYSVSTDVVGHLVEIFSGQPLDVALAERFFGPLGMLDTGFSVRPAEESRLAANYRPAQAGGIEVMDDPTTSRYLSPPSFFSGGGGLVSTLDDYHRFCLAMVRGGELDGARVMSRKMVEFATTNHLPDGRDIAQTGRPSFNGASQHGTGFGLCGAVLLDPAASGVIGSKGTWWWGGAASTTFFVDRAEDLTAVLLTQVMPSSTYPIRPELRALVYQALA